MTQAVRNWLFEKPHTVYSSDHKLNIRWNHSKEIFNVSDFFFNIKLKNILKLILVISNHQWHDMLLKLYIFVEIMLSKMIQSAVITIQMVQIVFLWIQIHITPTWFLHELVLQLMMCMYSLKITVCSVLLYENNYLSQVSFSMSLTSLFLYFLQQNVLTLTFSLL